MHLTLLRILASEGFRACACHRPGWHHYAGLPPHLILLANGLERLRRSRRSGCRELGSDLEGMENCDVPQGEAKRRAHAEQIGRDGHQLLAAIMAPAQIWLRQAWLQNFSITGHAPAAGSEIAPLVRRRTEQDGIPPSR
jgi:hypothetical protein